MSAQHTPGPWGFDWKSGDIFYLDGDVMPLVATVNLDAVSNEQALADLRLISAAPEMLAALELAERHVETLHSLVLAGGRKSGAVKIVNRDLNRIRAALAKARGAA